MSDSISIITWINHDLTDEEYERCRYPAKDRKDTNKVSANFRMQYPDSPLTGAGFKVTPLGVAIPGTRNVRLEYGRIAGYRVEVNPPACAIGHNRLLANSIPAAASIGFWLLKFWLASNGCTKEGLDRIRFENVEIVDATNTFLFKFDTEKEAQDFLAEYRAHTEAAMNYKSKKGHSNNPAFSVPPEPDEGPKAGYHYTAYVRHREYLIKAYVKQTNQPNATMLPLSSAALEAKVKEESTRIFRLEVQLHGKWLKDNNLSTVQQWHEHDDPYAKSFSLMSDLLRLNEGLRLHRLKKTSVASLPLNDRDQRFVLHHLEDKNVRTHPVFRSHSDFCYMTDLERRKYYSALKRRVLKKIGLDFDIPYAVQIKQMSARVCGVLTYQRKYVPPANLAGYVFSPTSFLVVIKKLKNLVAHILKYGPDSVMQVPKVTAYNGPVKTAGMTGIGSAHVKMEPEDDE
jgi:hypothetical protein